MGVRGQRHAPAAPYSRERPGTHCTGDWVGLRAGMNWCGKSRPTGIRSPTFISLQDKTDLKHSFKHKDHGHLGFHAA